eukprot:6207725-Pleurochrysis_carterae.AAC.3
MWVDGEFRQLCMRTFARSDSSRCSCAQAADALRGARFGETTSDDDAGSCLVLLVDVSCSFLDSAVSPTVALLFPALFVAAWSEQPLERWIPSDDMHSFDPASAAVAAHFASIQSCFRPCTVLFIRPSEALAVWTACVCAEMAASVARLNRSRSAVSGSMLRRRSAWPMSLSDVPVLSPFAPARLRFREVCMWLQGSALDASTTASSELPASTQFY